ncbi:hypothetical protein [Paracoccus onubensis]|uniref:hypothetical protein n=1 Tax=Paracoccus onubensis TaxID=1675788 RepID=UPI001E344FE9|nr:hypothetical protein [Paracoccus onubensis]
MDDDKAAICGIIEREQDEDQVAAGKELMFLLNRVCAAQIGEDVVAVYVTTPISEFLNEGILIETGRRACKNGFTVVYRISLAAVRTLEGIAEPDDETGPPRGPNHP